MNESTLGCVVKLNETLANLLKETGGVLQANTLDCYVQHHFANMALVRNECWERSILLERSQKARRRHQLQKLSNVNTKKFNYQRQELCKGSSATCAGEMPLRVEVCWDQIPLGEISNQPSVMTCEAEEEDEDVVRANLERGIDQVQLAIKEFSEILADPGQIFMLGDMPQQERASIAIEAKSVFESLLFRK